MAAVLATPATASAPAWVERPASSSALPAMADLISETAAPRWLPFAIDWSVMDRFLVMSLAVNVGLLGTLRGIGEKATKPV